MFHGFLSVMPSLLATAATGQFSVSIAVVFAIILVALILFVTEAVPMDVTALAVIVALTVLEPWTMIGPREGISGFANPATITVLAMFVLSEGVRRTGFLQWLADKVVELTGGSPVKKFGLLIGLSGSAAGMINNTPVVAMMIPTVSDIARKTKTSPSKFLMPISFISMIGGMLTLIGTSTNLLASDISERLIGRPFSMFEFTHLGAILLVIGFLYLVFIGRHLIPERIKPDESLADEYEMDDYLTEVEVREDSPLIGYTVREALHSLELDADIVHLIRDGQKFAKPLARKEVAAADRLMIRTDRENLERLLEVEALAIVPATGLEDKGVNDPQRRARRLAEVVVLPATPIVGETIASLDFEARYEASVLAIRRGRRVIHDQLDEFVLTGGDSLLVLASPRDFEAMNNDRRFVVVDKERPMRKEKMPIALAIVLAVVLGAAFGPFPILVTALGGVIAMVLSGCLDSNEAYDAVDWQVVFLLAGMIPLGVSLEATGGAALIAGWIVAAADVMPAMGVLLLFYVSTALITQVISNNASVVLMIPVAITAAGSLNADPFAFVMAVTFAASTAMMTPIGYQTNLMVYGPGGYRFGDYFRVGAPLQLILAVATTLGIWFFWGV